MIMEPCAGESAFIGKLTAEATHELNNILAIIRESAGLIQDLAHLSDRTSTDREKSVQRCLDTIEQQIEKGVVLLRDLNRLAHSPDHPISEIVAEEAAAQLIRLCSREALRQRVRLRIRETENRTALTTCPSLFYMVLYIAVQVCLTSLNCPGEVTVSVSPDKDVLIIEISVISDKPGASVVSFPGIDTPLFINLSALLAQLSEKAEYSRKDNVLCLTLPLNQAV